jgi:hypothetical protein
MPGWAGAQGENITITSCFAATSLNAVFSGGYWGHDPGSPYTSLAEDIDIRSYNNDDWGPLLLAAVFQIWMDNSDGRKGFAHQTYRNIRIEGPLSTPLLDLKNVVYPWGGPTAVSPPLGNAYDIVFQDVSFVGTQKYRSEIKGWDAQDGFHDVVLDDFSFNGEIVGPQNLAKYFDVNAYVWGLGFTAPETPCAGDDRPPGAGETARAPVLPVDGPCAAVSVARPR